MRQIDKLIERLGGAGEIARKCRITRQAVCQWDKIPTRFVLRLARDSAVTPHEMRADLYPHRLDGTRPAKAANGSKRA